MGAVVQRGSHGHFLPGQSGNAGGRPASLARVRELLKPHTERFVAELVQLLDSDEEAIRLAAIKEFMDRYIGKPVATVESDVRHMDVNQAIQQNVVASRVRQSRGVRHADDRRRGNNIIGDRAPCRPAM